MNAENRVRQSRVLGRRQAIVGAAGAVSGMALWPARTQAEPEGEICRSEEAIHQMNVFKASRKRVYDTLTQTKPFDALTQWSPEMRAGKSLGSVPTKISSEVGGEFFLFGGHIVGRHLELVPNERIVQAWRVVDWEQGLYSIARFQLFGGERRNQDCVRSHRVSEGSSGALGVRVEGPLLGRIGEIPGVARGENLYGSEHSYFAVVKSTTSLWREPRTRARVLPSKE